MQYKQSKKIIIDKRKLDTLIRLNCPDDRILSIIKTGIFEPTQDELLDETLESLIDIKEFQNWGGSRPNAGRKKSKINQDENQLENQDTNQVVDIDKDIDKDKDIDLNIETLFFDFWENYTPIKCNGKFVDKGSRKISFEKFSKIIKSGVKYENIISGLHAYLNHCRANNQLTCGVPVFLNQQRWLDDYNSTTVDSTNTTGERQEPRSMLEVYAEIANQYK